MFGIGEFSSLTWDSAAWIYSVVIGVVLARYFMFIANLLQEPKAIKFYYPYLAFILAGILHLYMSWYTGKQAYTYIEGKTLVFAIKSLMDATACVAGLIIVPKDKLLEDFFDMKSWFMKIKKAYFFIFILYFLLHLILGTLIATENLNLKKSHLIGFSVVMVINILLNVVSSFSINDYYLSFHGTLMLVFLSIQLSAL